MAVYINGLVGGFLFDDYSNIVRNTVLRLTDGSVYHWFTAALSSGSGLLRRPISMLSFAANFYFFGMEPLAFKIVNLLLHLLTGLLVYKLAVRLIPYLSRANDQTTERSRWLALITAALWLLHPLNVSDVVYIVQRMNQLATFFILAGLICYTEGRRRTLAGDRGLLVAFSGVVVFGLLAVFSKENGALIVLYAFVIEAVCFRFAGARTTQRATAGFFALCLGLPLLLVGLYLITHPNYLPNGYSTRSFTLVQRLLTEPRILFHYLQWIFVPLPSSMGIYHDDIPISAGLFAPVTTVIAIAGLVCAALVALVTRSRLPAFTFAVAWFLAGHAMESTILPLEIVFEHRNYLPMVGLLMGLTVVLADALPGRKQAIGGAGVAVLVIVGLSGATAVRAYAWGDPNRLALTGARHHPESPRSWYDAGRALIYQADANDDLDNARLQARAYFEKSMALDPTYIYPSMSYLLTYYGKSSVPDAAVSDLVRRIRNTLSFHATPVLMIIDAVADGNVPMTPAQIESVVTAALDNRHARSGVKAMVLNNYGRYQFTIRNDKQAAVSLTMAAVEQDPRNSLLRINLANLAIAMERYDIAQQAIERADELDKIGLYAKDTARIRQTIKTKQAAVSGK